MPNINLIADRREEKKKLERLTRQLFFGLAGSVGALALLVIFLGTQQYSASAELNELNARMAELQPQLDRIAQTEKLTSELQPKVATLEEARDATMRYRALLQDISQAVPAGAWVTNVASSGETQDTSLRLTGTAASQTIVALAMTQLQARPTFDKVDLVSTNLSGGQDGNSPLRYSFELNAHLRPPATAEEKKKAAEEAAAAAAGAGTPGASPAPAPTTTTTAAAPAAAPAARAAGKVSPNDGKSA
jgi:Tfp pilus assembly protein PilN